MRGAVDVKLIILRRFGVFNIIINYLRVDGSSDDLLGCGCKGSLLCLHSIKHNCVQKKYRRLNLIVRKRAPGHKYVFMGVWTITYLR